MYSISRRIQPAALIPGALLLGLTASGDSRADELLPGADAPRRKRDRRRLER
jgi:hypothetical protein